MKKLLTSTVLVLFLFSCKKDASEVHPPDLQEKSAGSSKPESLGSWYSKACFPGPDRFKGVAFSIGKKSYVGTGGVAKRSEPLQDFWEYDPATNTWSRKADFPGGPFYTAQGFGIGDKGYLGMDGYEKGGFWEYCPKKNEWTRKADLPEKRSNAVAFSIGKKGYIVTGVGPYNGGEQKRDLWEYDPSKDRWTRKADFPGQERQGATGFAVGAKGYVGTGFFAHSNSSPWMVALKDFWEYDPAKDKWTRKADFPGDTRYYATGFGLSEKGYLGFGYGDVDRGDELYAKDLWEYSPKDDTWTRKKDLPGNGRAGAFAFSIGNIGFIGSGSIDHGKANDLWMFKP